MPPDNHIAVVTGASRGLGRDVAIGLAVTGIKVALVARSEEKLQETAQTIRQRGGLACTVPANLSDPAQVELVKREVQARLGPPSTLVNAAGMIGPLQLIHDSDPDRWIETIMTNTVAPYLMSRAFVGRMIEYGWGRIINFSSAASLASPGLMNSAYVVSKVALNQFTRQLAAELDGTGVTANVIHPGEVKTDMWADIRDAVEDAGPSAEGFRRWVHWVEETDGDSPQKAIQLVLKLMGDDAADTNGQFLWIENGLQTPIASW